MGRKEIKLDTNNKDYGQRFNLKDNEKFIINLALVNFDGNKTKAAGALGITIKTLYNKLHEYGMFEQWQKTKGVNNENRSN